MNESELQYVGCEVSWGSTWVDLNDHERFVISSEGTRDSATRGYRKVVADSPILGGNYLIHAVPEMVVEQVAVRVFGEDQSGLAENFFLLGDLFEQYDYRVRWTFNNYREYWRCQLADASVARGQVWTHNTMAVSTFSVPRYPYIERETL